MTTPREPCWISVPGGICLYGDAGRPRPIPDLLVARTALTCAPARAAAVPGTGIDHAQASDLAASVGGRLPTSAEWEWIAAGAARRMYPWGGQPWTPSRAVLAGCGCNPRGPGPAGGRPCGATPQGVLDLAGNVWEWTASTVMGGGAIIRGGSYASRPLYARTTFINTAPTELRSPGISVRP